jgi:hypothetical protein
MVKKSDLTSVRALVGDMVTWLWQHGRPLSDEVNARIHAALEALGASEEHSSKVLVLAELPAALAIR